MEMEDHHNHHNQYNLDLRQFITTGRPTHHHHHHHFPTIPPPQPQQQQPPDHLFRTLQPQHIHQPYDMMMLMPTRGGGSGGGGNITSEGFHDFHCETMTATTTGAAGTMTDVRGGHVVVTTANSGTISVGGGAAATTFSGLEAEHACSFGGLGDIGGNGRWPRQETLTLLEIRSRLDPKFKEANQKGPLWDEVSRIMSEEHGYQRSGKKCREKFENLYKYYKKTKEGKAGRQDGKHYRFFRQLEALYGETSNQGPSMVETQYLANSLRFHNVGNISTQGIQEGYHPQKLCDSLSLSNNSSEFDSSSSEDNDLSTATLVDNDSIEKRRKRRDGKSWKMKIKEFIDLQMKKLIERQESWLDKLTKTIEQKEHERMIREEEWRKHECERIDKEHKFWAKERAWIEARDTALMEALQKIAGNDHHHHQVDASSSEELIRTRVVEENGSDQTSDHHHHQNLNLLIKDGNKKRKENSRGNITNCYNFHENEHCQSIYNNNPGEQQEGSSPGNSNVANAVSESCFRYLMSSDHGDQHQNIWENYGLKLSKGDNDHEHQNN